MEISTFLRGKQQIEEKNDLDFFYRLYLTRMAELSLTGQGKEFIEYAKSSLDESQNSFIGKKIGTSDGKYNLVSKYIMLEMGDEFPSANNIPPFQVLTQYIDISNSIPSSNN